jgi:site-specific DNA-methyltransferase (adenine-specific)
VLDIFMGSGTTAKMSILNDRKWIGFEISKDYCDIIDTRVKGLYSQISLF